MECLDDELGIADWDGEDYFAAILREYLASGRGRSSRVGGASSELLEAADLADFGAHWMSEHLNPLPNP